MYILSNILEHRHIYLNQIDTKLTYQTTPNLIDLSISLPPLIQLHQGRLHNAIFHIRLYEDVPSSKAVKHTFSCIHTFTDSHTIPQKKKTFT